MNAPLRRPATLDGFRQVSARYFTGEAMRRGLAFRPRPSDVFIATYAKAGTTWMQQIVHGLRTAGAMDFAEITEVVPWIEVAHDLGIDAEAEQAAWPRAFKTHLAWHEVPKGGRYIAIFRDPRAVAVSLYRFLAGWMFERGSIPFATFLREEFVAAGGDDDYWRNTLSWWRAREREDVLPLVYEDMAARLPQVVAKVARFIGLEPSPAAIEVATRQARFDFMKRHAGRFDDNLLRRWRDRAAGLPPDGESNKVASARSGDERLDDDLLRLLDRRWQDGIARHSGLADYAALRRSIAMP